MVVFKMRHKRHLIALLVLLFSLVSNKLSIALPNQKLSVKLITILLQFSKSFSPVYIEAHSSQTRLINASNNQARTNIAKQCIVPGNS